MLHLLIVTAELAISEVKYACIVVGDNAVKNHSIIAIFHHVEGEDVGSILVQINWFEYVIVSVVVVKGQTDFHFNVGGNVLDEENGTSNIIRHQVVVAADV